MAQTNLPSYYARGHSEYTIATHLRRKAETDAAFLLPHIKTTDHILDVGCGPGTITTSLAKYASQGKTVGIDLSTDVLQKARALADESNAPTQGPGSVVFEEGNVVDGLAYPDNTFDVVYSSQVLGHLPQPDIPLRALAEMRRVLKPGGILATRDGMGQHFYPQSFDLDRLWGANQLRASRKGKPEADPTATVMPALLRKAGFDVDGGKVHVGAGTSVFSDAEARKRLAWRADGQLQPGDPFYQSWLDAGISEDEIQQTLRAVRRWADTEDAWLVLLQCEILAWK
ncbi:methyltransferase-UbiE family protein [Trichoderma harzianum]|uniref:Methyltransferase-UbiE family protein n=1 Tax=Trichoderma harzianum TaxID=5544 RepID=A0A0G0A3N7_TRIHA|nr:methyltransferase-UbiE family protein [Trichoderma harzianum]